jgi:hypothetical protein
MEWVTRERPKIDRIACPWLISTIVRCADTSRLDLTPQSAGLCAISLGLSATIPPAGYPLAS